MPDGVAAVMHGLCDGLACGDRNMILQFATFLILSGTRHRRTPEVYIRQLDGQIEVCRSAEPDLLGHLVLRSIICD